VNHNLSGKTIDGGAFTTPPSMASSRQPHMKSEQNFYTNFCINYSRHMIVQPHPLGGSSRHILHHHPIDILTVDISLLKFDRLCIQPFKSCKPPHKIMLKVFKCTKISWMSGRPFSMTTCYVSVITCVCRDEMNTCVFTHKP